MALICSICNEVPEQPVLSPASQQIFERRLIEKYITENGTDPINEEQLSIEDLIDIKFNPLSRPRPPSATSIPAILKMLQDEWDACMLQTFTLRQHLQATRQELSHVLYQHDAACRVIARLTKENTSLKETLSSFAPVLSYPTTGVGVQPEPILLMQTPAPTEDGDMEISEPAQIHLVPETKMGTVTEEVKQRLQDTSNQLTVERKKRGRKPPDSLASPNDISDYEQIESHPGLHSASAPGILSLDLSYDFSKVVTGGVDKNAVIFHRPTAQILFTLKGHKKPVTNVLYHPYSELIFTASSDSTTRVWNGTSGNCQRILKAHDSEITSLSMHATGDFLFSCSTDGYWAFIEIETGTILAKAANENSQVGFSCGQFHPDGLIFGTGTVDSVVRIWDLKDQTNVANFEGHQGPIASLAFSENGYYLATVGDDSQVKIWDLRKQTNIKTLNFDDNYRIRHLSFDKSGQYLSVAGNDIQVYMVKQWNLLQKFKEHNAATTCVRFGPDANFIASTSMDRTLKFYGKTISDSASTQQENNNNNIT